MSKAAESTRKFLTSVVERSRPSKQRPRMAEDVEARLEEVERKSAACYAELEMNSFALSKLAKEIEDSDGVPDPIEESDSAVVHIEELQAKAKIPT